MDRRFDQSGVCLGESLKLSLNTSFTLDSAGSNPAHSKSPLGEAIFFCIFKNLIV